MRTAVFLAAGRFTAVRLVAVLPVTFLTAVFLRDAGRVAVAVFFLTGVDARGDFERLLAREVADADERREGDGRRATMAENGKRGGEAYLSPK